MSKPQYAILRFAKYKGPEIGNIEAHNERTKEKYASNPDVDISRSKYNFHLITPQRKYRAEAERQIKEAGCRTRSDSVRVVEALVTATPEFFQGKKESEIRAYFQEALTFIQQNQDPKTIISAVVHMDECCFSKRMRKVFKKNEKSMLQFCNKNSKKKRAFTMG